MYDFQELRKNKTPISFDPYALHVKSCHLPLSIRHNEKIYYYKTSSALCWFFACHHLTYYCHCVDRWSTKQLCNPPISRRDATSPKKSLLLLVHRQRHPNYVLNPAVFLAYILWARQTRALCNANTSDGTPRAPALATSFVWHLNHLNWHRQTGEMSELIKMTDPCDEKRRWNVCW